MSKSKTGKRDLRGKPSKEKSSKQRLKIVLITSLVLSAIVTAIAVSGRTSLLPSPPTEFPNQSGAVAAPASLSASGPSKEYIYAGGRLVAIEEGSSSPPPPASSATFIRTDTTTRGNWKSAYGASGFYVVNDSYLLGSNVQLSADSPEPYTWANRTSNVSHLQKSGSNLRIAAIWSRFPTLTVNLNLADGVTRQVAIYCYDFDAVRNQTFQIFDHATGMPLDSARTISGPDFASGLYLIWNIRGNVDIKATYNGTDPFYNAVISGIFIDGPNGQTLARDTVGVFDTTTPSGVFYLRNSHTSGFADTDRSDITATFGSSTDYPIVGDWNNDGVPTPGVYRDGTFLLRNSNTTGPAETAITFGSPGDQPIVGDWDNNGTKTIGVYRSGTFFLRNSNTTGPPDMTFSLGISGDVAIAGDWDGDGRDTVGVFRPVDGTLFLKNSNTTGFADLVLAYGLPGDRPVVGDWDGNGTDTIGVFRNGTFFLRDTNTNGFANRVFVFGHSSALPLAGNWDRLP